MRTVKLITTICWIVTALILVGLAIWFLTGSLFGFAPDGWDSILSSGFSFSSIEKLSGSYEEVGSYNVPADEVDSFDIMWVTGNVTVVPYDGSEIKLIEYARRALEDDELLKLTTTNGKLRIAYCSRTKWVRIPQKKLELFIPDELSKSIHSFIVDSTSGDVNLESISAKDMNIDSVSGSIKLSDIYAPALSLDSMSGSIDVIAATSDHISINTISGSVKAIECTSEKLNCDSTSGSFTLSGSFENVSLNTISGSGFLDNTASNSTVKTDSTSGSMDLSGSFHSARHNSISGTIKVASSIVPVTFSSDTTSAKVTLTIPDEGPVNVNHSSVSGKLTSDVPVTMVSSGNAQLRFTTISGEVRILVPDQNVN